MPGQFIRVRIDAGTVSNGVVIPTRAVRIQGEKASVTMLLKDGKTSSRIVELGDQSSAGWTVRRGLKPGDRIITNGWQAIQPGQRAEVVGEFRPNTMKGR